MTSRCFGELREQLEIRQENFSRAWQNARRLFNSACRGTFRTSAAKWFNPDDVVPPDSRPSSSGRGMQSKLALGKVGAPEITFRLPDRLAPVFLAFELQTQHGQEEDLRLGPRHGAKHFAVPVGLSRGNPLKYGRQLSVQ